MIWYIYPSCLYLNYVLFFRLKVVRNVPNKKKQKKEWSQESKIVALDKVFSKGLGYGKAAWVHGIFQTTLERYVKKFKQGAENTVGLPVGLKSVFS